MQSFLTLIGPMSSYTRQRFTLYLVQYRAPTAKLTRTT